MRCTDWALRLAALSTVDLPAVPLHVQVVKRRVP
jgi:hypothetical protein